MRLIDKQEMTALVDHREPRSVSIYVPTHLGGADTRQDPIRFKNQLNIARDALMADGMTKGEAGDYLKPLARLVEDSEYWQHQSLGLAMFHSAAGTREYHLPLAVPESATVGDRFYLRPLVPLLGADQRYFILALSQKHSRLYEASQDSISEVDVPDMPHSVAEALVGDDPERSLQWHTGSGVMGPSGAPGTPGSRRAMFHGQGMGDDTDRKTKALEYCRQVDTAVCRALAGQHQPLMLAAPQPTAALYRQANHHPSLVEAVLHCKPELLTPQELHRMSLPVIAPELDKTRQEVIIATRELQPGGQVATTVESVLNAAVDGRILNLLVARDASLMGHYDPMGRRLLSRSADGDGAVDLIELAATMVYKTGGDIFQVDAGELPGPGPMAGILRYPTRAAG